MNEILNYINTLTETTNQDMSSGMVTAYIITGIVFVVLGAGLIYLYLQQRSSGEALRKATEHRSAGSFAGFWGRNRGAIILFIAVVCLLVGLTLIGIPLGVSLESSDLM